MSQIAVGNMSILLKRLGTTSQYTCQVLSLKAGLHLSSNTPRGWRSYHYLQTNGTEASGSLLSQLDRSALSLSFINGRHVSTLDTQQTIASTASGAAELSIPEPPSVIVNDTPAEPISAIYDQLNALGEPTMASLGLGSWWPPGIVQNSLDLLHCYSGLPWYATIFSFALLLRLLMLPLQVKVMRISIHQNNVLPEFIELGKSQKRAEMMGDTMTANLKAFNLMKYQKKHKPNPLKQAATVAYQAPFFISSLIGVRAMANLPLESWMTGGALWVTDLTVPDPYYILPVCNGLALMAAIRFGADGFTVSSLSRKAQFGVFGFAALATMAISTQPAALSVYWLGSSCISLAIIKVLQTSYIKQKFNIPTIKKSEQTSEKKESAKERMQRSSREKQLMNKRASREEESAKQFRSVGFSEVVKTYPYDPTKPRKSKKDPRVRNQYSSW